VTCTYIRLKSSWRAKEIMNKAKRQPTEWDKKILSSDRGTISRIHKELKKLNTKRTSKSINKWANNLNRHFSKEMINK
jgi:hypothetical protein